MYVLLLCHNYFTTRNADKKTCSKSQLHIYGVHVVQVGIKFTTTIMAQGSLIPRPLPLRERRPGTHCVRMRQIYEHFFSKIHRIH